MRMQDPSHLAPSVAHEIKVLMSSPYQQMPSWPCHQWLAWSQRRGLTASPFKGCSPATASPQIPSLSISLCYIYYLHLDNVLSDRPFFLLFRSNCSDSETTSPGMSRGVENLTSPSWLPFSGIPRTFPWMGRRGALLVCPSRAVLHTVYTYILRITLQRGGHLRIRGSVHLVPAPVGKKLCKHVSRLGLSQQAVCVCVWHTLCSSGLCECLWPVTVYESN